MCSSASLLSFTIWSAQWAFSVLGNSLIISLFMISFFWNFHPWDVETPKLTLEFYSLISPVFLSWPFLLSGRLFQLYLSPLLLNSEFCLSYFCFNFQKLLLVTGMYFFYSNLVFSFRYTIHSHISLKILINNAFTPKVSFALYIASYIWINFLFVYFVLCLSF